MASLAAGLADLNLSAVAAPEDDVAQGALAIVMAFLRGALLGSAPPGLLRSAADVETSFFHFAHSTTTWYPLSDSIPQRLRDALRCAEGRAACTRAAARLACLSKATRAAVSHRDGCRAAAAARRATREQARRLHHVVTSLAGNVKPAQALLDDNAVADALTRLCADGVTPKLEEKYCEPVSVARMSAAILWITFANRVFAKIESLQQGDLESLAKYMAYMGPGDEGFEALQAEAALYNAEGPQTDLSEVGVLIVNAAPPPPAAA